MTLMIAIHPMLAATLWGLVSGSALVLGALVGYFRQVKTRTIGMIMAFGSGVLISALAFDLMDEAYATAGILPACIGFVSGAIIYSVANYLLNRRGAEHRKRSGNQQASEHNRQGSGLAIALGALVDGIPESVAIGVSMIESTSVSISAVIAIFLSNVPEALSSTSGMKKAGRSAKFIFGIWIMITLLSGAGAFAGYTIFASLSPSIIAVCLALAAGAILAMLSSTMIPEAFEDVHDLTGVITVAGFLAAFTLSKMQP